MCGRASLSITNPDELEGLLKAAFADPQHREDYKPRFNVGPMSRHWIVVASDAGRLIHRARWGVERVIGKNADGSYKNATPFNTMAETAFDKPSWKKALAERRCVVPMTGFYEWTGEKKARTPVHFTRRDGGMILLAGVYDEPKDDAPRGFSVLTCAPNVELAAVHTRMACILEPDAVDGWLREGGPLYLRTPPDGVVLGAPANPAMNGTGKGAPDGPECLVPPKASAATSMEAHLDLFRRPE